MPVSIYRVLSDDRVDLITGLCHGEWLLCVQVDELSKWLELNSGGLESAEYVADVCFRWRRSASAGGPVTAPATMKRMVDIGMSLYLSELSGFADKATVKSAEPGAAPSDGPASPFDGAEISGGPPSVT